MTIKPTGDAVISGNLDVSASNARTSIKAYNTTEGYTSYIELEAKWDSQGYLHFESNKPGAHYLFLTVKNGLHMYCGNNLVHMYKDTTIDGNLDVGTTGNNSIKYMEQELLLHTLYLQPIMVIILIGGSKMAIILKHGLIY